MRIVIATAGVPFTRGSADIIAEELRDALHSEGHEAEIISIPFKWRPPEILLSQMLACRLLDLSESVGKPVDRVIGLRFPAYLIPHPNKVLWVVHQHRAAYDLWSDLSSDLIRFPNGARIRDAIRHADQRLLPEAKAIFTISRNVSYRLKKYCDIDSTPLYQPPREAGQYYCAAAENYFFFPSRLLPIKRHMLALEALAQTREPVHIRFAGPADHPPYAEELRTLALKLNVHHRVEWIGHMTEEERRGQYAHALGVVYPPLDENDGYVTLEAMMASKPVITCPDSGGPLEFVLDGKTGCIAEATPKALADAMDNLWGNRDQARMLGEAGRAHYEGLDITWPKVIQGLLS